MPENQNSFAGTVKKFVNEDIHAFIGKVLSLRQQLVSRHELKALSGWPDSVARFISRELERLSDQLAASTIKMSGKTREQWRDLTTDTTAILADSYDDDTFAADELMGGPGMERDLVWDLSGADVDIPQLTTKSHPNYELRMFITKLDFMVRELSRLNSRHYPTMIEKYDSAKIRAQHLEKLWAINQRYGGSDNASDVPNAVLPSQEPDTLPL